MFKPLVLLVPLMGVLVRAEWKLVWSDEFSGGTLNSAEWVHEVGCTGWGNHELQCYTTRPANAYLRNGTLVIDALVERYQEHDFTSARLKSKRAWTYGKFEARARMPQGHHLWPAIWMMPRDSKYGGWAASGEIDIVEFRGDRPNEISGAIHYGGSWPHNTYSGTGDRQFPTDFSKDFHTFAVEWDSKSIRWLLDGTPIHTENIDRSMWSGRGPNPYTQAGQPFDQRFYFILNLAVGGTFFGPGPYVTPDEARHWAKHTLEVDYVRVYQKNG